MARIKILMSVIVCALILTACGKEPMPEVNDTNCAPEKRGQIKDKDTRIVALFGVALARCPAEASAQMAVNGRILDRVASEFSVRAAA